MDELLFACQGAFLHMIIPYYQKSTIYNYQES